MTARSACWITPCETLPRSGDFSPLSPRDPIRIALAPIPSASARIASEVVVSCEQVRRCASNPDAASQLRSLLGPFLGTLARGLDSCHLTERRVGVTAEDALVHRIMDADVIELERHG
jgi:hypothetical protein